MPATFKVGRGDSSVDACSECYRVSDVTVAEQVCCRVAIVALPAGVSVAVLAAGFPGAVILSAAATVYTATGARAASAILNRSRRKKSSRLRINHLRACIHIDPHFLLLPRADGFLTLFFSSYSYLS